MAGRGLNGPRQRAPKVGRPAGGKGGKGRGSIDFSGKKNERDRNRKNPF
ncbi:MAG: hypothetical protein JW795_15510 [Chitinivibrionales bacterium]|nr:hypothetical protein [Chitinivibrionales bacterium]